MAKKNLNDLFCDLTNIKAGKFQLFFSFMRFSFRLVGKMDGENSLEIPYLKLESSTIC